jgi:hypothetical protein
MASFGMLRRVALVRADVSVERIVSIIRVKKNQPARNTLRSALQLLVTANAVPSSPNPLTMMMEAIALPKCQFLKSHTAPQHNTSFFIITAVKTSNLT